jgi:hypothetical protein
MIFIQYCQFCHIFHFVDVKDPMFCVLGNMSGLLKLLSINSHMWYGHLQRMREVHVQRICIIGCQQKGRRKVDQREFIFNLQSHMQKAKLNLPHILGNSLCYTYLMRQEDLLAGL